MGIGFCRLVGFFVLSFLFFSLSLGGAFLYTPYIPVWDPLVALLMNIFAFTQKKNFGSTMHANSMFSFTCNSIATHGERN